MTETAQGSLPDDTAPEVAVLAREIRRDHPRFRLVAKEDSPLMRALARLMVWNPEFLTGFTTTVGYRVYMPRAYWTDPVGGVDVLRHERVHVEQFARHPVWFPLSYVLLLPAGITMRARWEMEAYEETMRAELERTGTISDATLDRIEGLFTGPAYLYMDVRRARVRRRLEETRTRLLAP